MSVAPSDHPRSVRTRLGRRGLLVSAAVAAFALAFSSAVAADAAGVPTATVNTNTATARGQVTLTLANYQPSESLTVTLDGSPAQTYPNPGYAQNTTDASGSYSAAVYFPSSITTGAHILSVAGSASAMTSTPTPIPITIVPQPTGSVTPSTVVVSAYQSTGVTVTFSGFTPGTSVVFGVGNQSSGGPIGNPVTADATGTATIHYVPTVGSPYSTAGTYTLSAYGSAGSYAAKQLTLIVTADPAPAAPPAPVAAPATPVKQTASFTG